jgi:pimeloyl-ACP methyl ester carboxylesterase
MFGFSVAAAAAERKPASIKSFDGLPLETVVELPEKLAKADVKKVMVFVHGSGPQNLDEDLSDVTVPAGTKNYFFRDLADEFRRRGFATVRYNKRHYEEKKLLEANPELRKSPAIKRSMAHPLEYLIKDAVSFANYAHQEFPNAEVHFLGHSEGTVVALNAATRLPKLVKGVVLIGFYSESVFSLVWDQVVNRPVRLFQELDVNHDDFLSSEEMKAESPVAKSIQQQMSVLDLNRDGKLSLNEFKAGNYVNLVMKDVFLPAYAHDEANLPRPASLVKDAKSKILFLQGEYDNQTPSYFTKAIELSNNLQWKKPQLKFVYFAKAGHALDPRESVDDIYYKVLPAETLTRIGTEVADFLNR